MRRRLTTIGFNDALTLISLWGFLVIFLSAFDVVDLNAWQTTVLMILAGAGLMVEGRIATANRWMRDGVQGTEFLSLFTIIAGGVTLIVGVLVSPVVNLELPQLDGIIGLIAIASFGFIAVQRWFVR